MRNFSESVCISKSIHKYDLQALICHVKLFKMHTDKLGKAYIER